MKRAPMKKVEPRLFLCSICQKPITPEKTGWKLGHNAQPINDGRCCTFCNETVVIPERLKWYSKS